MLEQRGGHVVDRGQKYTVHKTRCRHVIIGTMGRIRPTERTHQIKQTVRSKAGQCNFGQVERIDPVILLQHFACRIFGTECPIEICVVCDYIGRTDELHQTSNSSVGVGSMCHIFIANVGKMRNFFGDRLPGIYEGYVPTSDFPMNHARSGDLNQLVMIE